MSDRGPFLWISRHSPPAGFTEPPRGGMCVCAFLFVTRDDQILLGKYADDPKWEELAGLDQGRRRTNANGWTIPASHLKFGEDPASGLPRILPDLEVTRWNRPAVRVRPPAALVQPGELLPLRVVGVFPE